MSELKKLVIDLILLPIPFIDKEWIELGLGFGDWQLSGFTPIYLSQMSGGQKLLLFLFLISPIPREVFEFIWDPLYTPHPSGPKLDDPYWKKTGRRRRAGGSGMGVASGARQARQELKIDIDKKKHDLGYKFTKAVGMLFLFLIIVVPLGFFLLSGTVAGDYADYGGQLVGNKYLAGVGTQFQGAAKLYTRARGRVVCLLKGPACLRQWRLNNTVRPGSEDIGETYGLKIDRFELGQGEQLDIAYRDADYAIPLSFTLSNPRHGLKGINAEDVAYRIKVIDFDRDRNHPYCDTGWIDVEDAYDTDSDGLRDDIFPGLSASTGFLTITSDGRNGSVQAPEDGLTLKDCEMLQPALGEHKTVLLSVRYDYFSQATLYFDAMSQESFQSNPELSKHWEKSKTADTPVKAAVNVNSPVLFSQNTGEPQPFSIRATLNTPKNDVKYRINDLVVKNSGYVIKASRGTCQFENTRGGTPGPGDTLVPQDGQGGRARSDNAESNSARANMIADSDPRRNKDYYWFDSERTPPIAGCVMELSETSSISPTGETLTMGVAANYTVSKSYKLGNFEALNTRCSRINCPMIVTLQDNSSADYNFMTECDGVDAGNGCSIVEADLENWGGVGTVNTSEGVEIRPLNHRVEGGEPGEQSDTVIDNGEVAVKITDQVAENGDTTGETYYAGLSSSTWGSIGRDMFEGSIEESASSDDVYDGENYAIVHYRNSDGEYEVEIQHLSSTLCGSTGSITNPMQEFIAREAEADMDILVWECGRELSPGGEPPGSGGGGSLTWLDVLRFTMGIP